MPPARQEPALARNGGHEAPESRDGVRRVSVLIWRRSEGRGVATRRVQAERVDEKLQDVVLGSVVKPAVVAESGEGPRHIARESAVVARAQHGLVDDGDGIVEQGQRLGAKYGA